MHCELSECGTYKSEREIEEILMENFRGAVDGGS